MATRMYPAANQAPGEAHLRSCHHSSLTSTSTSYATKLKSSLIRQSISKIMNKGQLKGIPRYCGLQQGAYGDAGKDSHSSSSMLKQALVRPSTDALRSVSPLENAAFPSSNVNGCISNRLSAEKLLRIAVDVDEVLGSFLPSLNAFIAEQHSLKYNIAQYNVYDFMKVWRCSQAEANDRVHAFFESEHFNGGILPIPGAFEVLSSLSTFCDLVVVTSRQHVIKNQTLDWIKKHYAGIFTNVHFGNHFALEGAGRPKSEICREIGAEILIDDNPRYAVECAHKGIEVLLFDYHNSYPWSKTPDGPRHPLITRVYTWEDVERILFVHAYEHN